MKRIVLAALPLLVAMGCAAPPASEPSSLRDMPGVARDGAGAACASDLQSCDRTTPCCSGMTCVPYGRFGMLCRRPAVGGR